MDSMKKYARRSGLLLILGSLFMGFGAAAHAQCSITNVNFIVGERCDEDGLVNVAMVVYASPDAIGQPMEVFINAGSVLTTYTGTPTVVVYQLLGNTTGSGGDLNYAVGIGPDLNSCTTGGEELDILPRCKNCRIFNVEVSSLGECLANGQYEAEVIVSYSNPPDTGDLSIASQLFPITGSPQTETVLLTYDGVDFDFVVTFTDAPFQSTNCYEIVVIPTNLPACVSECTTALEVLSTSECKADGTIDVTVLVSYTNEPAAANLVLGSPGISSVSTAATGSPQTVVLNFFANGLPLDLFAAVSGSGLYCDRLYQDILTLPVCGTNTPSPCIGFYVDTIISSNCNENGLATVTFEVYASDDLIGEPLEVYLNQGAVLTTYTGTPTVVTFEILGDGGDVFSFVGIGDDLCVEGENLLGVLPRCENDCQLTRIELNSVGDCLPNGQFEVDITVTYTNLPATGDLSIGGQLFPITGSPQTETVILTHDGTSFYAPVFFTDAPFASVNCYEFINLYTNVPECISQCAVISAEVVSEIECKEDGTIDVSVLVAYTNAPVAANLILTAFNLGSTVIAATSSPQVVVVNVPGTGLDFDLSVTVAGEDLSCERYFDEMITLPVCEPNTPSPCVDFDVTVLVSQFCNSNGLVDVTFEVTASDDLIGEPLEVYLNLGSSLTTYTGTPTVVTYEIFSDGSDNDLGADLYFYVGIGDGLCETIRSIDNVLPVCEDYCQLTNISLTSVGDCLPNGQYEVEVTLGYTNAPITGDLSLAGQLFPITGSPQTETVILTYDGTGFFMPVSFTDAPFESIECFDNVTFITNLPPCDSECEIIDVAVVSQSECKGDGSIDLTILVSYTNAPVVANFGITAPGLGVSVITPATNSPQLISLNLPGNGSPLDLSVSIGGGGLSCNTLFEDILTLPLCGPPPSPSCIITSMELVEVGSCDSNGNVEVTFAVYANNALGDILSISANTGPTAGGSAVYAGTPTLVSFVMQGNGAAIDVTASFMSFPDCFFNFVSPMARPLCDGFTLPCGIQDLNVVSIGSCNTNGLVPVVVEVNYMNPPSTGDIVVAGQNFPITGSPQTVTLMLLGDGTSQDLVVSFEDYPLCGRYFPDAFILPECSDSCNIFDLVLLDVSECNADDSVDLTLELTYTNAPLGESIQITAAGISFSTTVTGSPQLLTINTTGSGVLLDFTATIGTDLDCQLRVNDLLTLPVCGDICAIQDVQVITVSECDSNNNVTVTMEVFATNTYLDAFIDVFYSNPSIEFAQFAYTGTPTVVDVTLSADGGTFEPDFQLQFLPNCNYQASDLLTLPICGDNCAILDAQVTAIGGCKSDGQVDVTIEVTYTNPPAFGSISLLGVDYPITGSPQSFTFTTPADGGSIDVFVSFTDVVPSASPGPQAFDNDALIFVPPNSCFGFFQNLITLPVCSNQCMILDVVVGAVGDCQPSGQYPVELTFIYANSPSTGTLDANGQSFPITGSPQTETVFLSPAIPVYVNFSEASQCDFYSPSLANFPACESQCEIQDVQFIGLSECLPGRVVQLTVEVTYTNAPLGGDIIISSDANPFYGSFPITTSPQRITVDIGTSGSLNLSLSLGDGCSAVFTDFVTIPFCPTEPPNCLDDLILTANTTGPTCNGSDVCFTLAAENLTVGSSAQIFYDADPSFNPLSGEGIQLGTMTNLSGGNDSVCLTLPLGVDVCANDIFVKAVVLTNGYDSFCSALSFISPSALLVGACDAVIISCPTNLSLGCNPTTLPPLFAGVSVSGSCVVATNVSVVATTNGCVVTEARTYSVNTFFQSGVAECTQTIQYSQDTTGPDLSFCASTQGGIACSPESASDGFTPLCAIDTGCGVMSLTTNEVLDSVGCTSTLTRVYTAIDGCGNESVLTNTVQWIDDLGVELVGSFTNRSEDLGCSPEAIPGPLALEEVLDAPCGFATMEIEDSGTVEMAETCSFSREIVYRATTFCGASNEVIEIFTWLEGGVISFDQDVVDSDVSCGTIVPESEMLTASDTCGGSLVVQVTTNSLAENCNGQAGVSYVYTASNLCGRTISMTQTILAVDTVAPVFSDEAPGLTLACGQAVPAALSLVATDDCGQDVTVSVTTNQLAANCSGNGVEYIYTATDACGNETTLTQTFAFGTDNAAPVISNCPEDQTVTGIGIDCTVMVPELAVTVSDECGATLVQTPAAGTVVNASTPLTISVTATDPCGNSSSCSVVYTYVCDVLLEGTVWYDTDNEGDVDEPLTNTAFSGITIEILDASSNVIGTALSDAMGGWSFAVPPGVYIVRVVDPPLSSFPIVTTKLEFMVEVGGGSGAFSEAPNFGFTQLGTSIDALSMEAIAEADGRVTVIWEPIAERDHLGYTVWRGTPEYREQIGELILADGATTYSLTTEDLGGPYWLQSISVDLSSTWHGPVEALESAFPMGEPVASYTAEDDEIQFTTTEDAVSILVTGFTSEPVIYDRDTGTGLRGEVITTDSGIGIYFSTTPGRNLRIFTK